MKPPNGPHADHRRWAPTQPPKVLNEHLSEHTADLPSCAHTPGTTGTGAPDMNHTRWDHTPVAHTRGPHTLGLGGCCPILKPSSSLRRQGLRCDTTRRSPRLRHSAPILQEPPVGKEYKYTLGKVSAFFGARSGTTSERLCGHYLTSISHKT